MTLAQVEIRSCSSKVVYDTRKRARDAAQIMSKRFSSKMGIYQCRYCNLFHFTTIR